ncbi:uncharacterized protein LOC106994380 [Macaca mulatta]
MHRSHSGFLKSPSHIALLCRGPGLSQLLGEHELRQLFICFKLHYKQTMTIRRCQYGHAASSRMHLQQEGVGEIHPGPCRRRPQARGCAAEAAFLELHGRPPGPQSWCISAIWLGRAGFEG